MTQYRGHYIDNVIFHNTEEIDNFIKAEDVRAYRQAIKIFAGSQTMAASIYMDQKAEKLVNEYGYTWEEVEAIEIETLEEIA
jgi:hypothetical protein